MISFDYSRVLLTHERVRAYNIDSLWEVQDELLIKGDVLIDDGFHYLEGGSYFKILIDAPYNQDYDAEKNGMVRVSTLKEAYDVIREEFS